MSRLRQIAKNVLPKGVRDGLRYVTNPGYRAVLRAQQAQRVVAEQADQIWAATAGRVASGPFQGLHYLREASRSAWAPKLLGTYEKELAPVIERVVASSPSWIVDIGAAEGYYAVGLASRLPNARIIAFEADEAGRRRLKDLAELNGAEGQIEVCGLCTSDTLNEALKGKESAVVVCDVEGAEFEILDPINAPSLTRSDILVEVHPWAHEQAAAVLSQRFMETHLVEEIHTQPRRSHDLPSLPIALPDPANCMYEERIGSMSWLWMTARREKSERP